MLHGAPGERKLLLSLAGRGKLERLLTRLFDENEFLSPHGLRALSAYHRDHPYQIQVEGITASIDYEPAESTTPLFGGNSNWRGPVWFPLNYLMISSLERYHQFLGEEFTIEYPTGSGTRLPLDKIAADLQDRLISLFTRDPDGQAGLLRRDRAAAERSRLAGQPGLRRVLPRRQRRRARRLAPDRLDRPDRRRDPPPPRPGPLGRRDHQAGRPRRPHVASGKARTGLKCGPWTFSGAGNPPGRAAGEVPPPSAWCRWCSSCSGSGMGSGGRRSGGAEGAGTRLSAHWRGGRVSICFAIMSCAARSRITGPSSHISAVDSGPAVDWGYWNPPSQPQDPNQPRLWET